MLYGVDLVIDKGGGMIVKEKPSHHFLDLRMPGMFTQDEQMTVVRLIGYQVNFYGETQTNQ